MGKFTSESCLSSFKLEPAGVFISLRHAGGAWSRVLESNKPWQGCNLHPSQKETRHCDGFATRDQPRCFTCGNHQQPVADSTYLG